MHAMQIKFADRVKTERQLKRIEKAVATAGGQASEEQQAQMAQLQNDMLVSSGRCSGWRRGHMSMCSVQQ
jgi:hypothetical protein